MLLVVFSSCCATWLYWKCGITLTQAVWRSHLPDDSRLVLRSAYEGPRVFFLCEIRTLKQLRNKMLVLKRMLCMHNRHRNAPAHVKIRARSVAQITHTGLTKMSKRPCGTFSSLQGARMAVFSPCVSACCSITPAAVAAAGTGGLRSARERRAWSGPTAGTPPPGSNSISSWRAAGGGGLCAATSPSFQGACWGRCCPRRCRCGDVGAAEQVARVTSHSANS